jgi:recombination protein RecA
MSKLTAQQLKQAINETFKDDKLMRMGNDPSFEVGYLPTGVMPFDYLLQGGLPRGRATEIFGPWSSLKSYVALRACAMTQQAGGVAALIDTEHAYDPKWAEQLGVNLDDLLLKRPDTGEQAIDLAEMMITNRIDLVVFDSVAALLPQQERSKRMHDENIQPARLAALMSQGLRKLTTANQDTALFFINQTREKVGIVFGNPESIPGGRSLPFYASYRISFRKGATGKRDIATFDGTKMVKVKEVHRQTIKATLEKSKLNKPFREIFFDFDLDTGMVDDVGFLINLAVERGNVQFQKGNLWRAKGAKKSTRGKEAFVDHIGVDKLKELAGMAEASSPRSGKRRVRVKKRDG